jgi:hypothetical protein
MRSSTAPRQVLALTAAAFLKLLAVLTVGRGGRPPGLTCAKAEEEGSTPLAQGPKPTGRVTGGEGLTTSSSAGPVTLLSPPIYALKQQ